MKNLLIALLIAASSTTFVGQAAFARQGADDAAGHGRHGAHHTANHR